MKFPLIVPGIDAPSLGHDMTNGEANTLVSEAQLQNNVGMHVYAEEAPNVITYPILKQFQWREIDNTGIETGNRYYWNGTAWTLERPPAGVINGDSFADDSIPVSKLSGTGAQAFYIIQRNGSNTGWMIVSIPSAIPDGGVQNIKLEHAPNADYIKFSGAGGVYTDALFQTIWDTYLDVSNIPFDQIQDSADVALPNQVLYFLATGGQAGVAFADTLLRQNQVALNKLKYPGGSAGKYLRVAANGTDGEMATPSATAVLKYTVANNAAPQTLTTTAAAEKITLNQAIDPDGIILVMAASQITLAPGKYVIDAFVPFSYVGGSTTVVAVVILRNTTAASDMATATAYQGGDADFAVARLMHTFTITEQSIFEFQIKASQLANLGYTANLGYQETHTQIFVKKQ